MGKEELLLRMQMCQGMSKDIVRFLWEKYDDGMRIPDYDYQ